MTQYNGPVFEILFLENGHALLRSETRPELAHSVDIEEHNCTCENFTIDKNPNCKHLKFLTALKKHHQQKKENK